MPSIICGRERGCKGFSCKSQILISNLITTENFIRNKLISIIVELNKMGNKSTYEKIKRIHIAWCKQCEEKHGKKDIDECFKCEFHKLFNEIYDSLNGA